MYNRLDRIRACHGRTDKTSFHGIVRGMHTCHAVIKLSAIYKEYLTGTGN